MQFLTDMMRNAPLVYYWCTYIVQLYIRHVLVSHYRNIWIRTIWQKLSSDTQYWLFITMKETCFLVGHNVAIVGQEEKNQFLKAQEKLNSHLN